VCGLGHLMAICYFKFRLASINWGGFHLEWNMWGLCCAACIQWHMYHFCAIICVLLGFAVRMKSEEAPMSCTMPLGMCPGVSDVSTWYVLCAWEHPGT
jgi:hypothetical protein